MKNIILTINNNFPNKYCDFELEPSFISSIAEDHTNAISDVIGLSTGLAQKSDVGHIHSENYISFINGKTNLVNVSSPNGQISSNQNDIRISIPRIKQTEISSAEYIIDRSQMITLNEKYKDTLSKRIRFADTDFSSGLDSSDSLGNTTIVNVKEDGNIIISKDKKHELISKMFIYDGEEKKIDKCFIYEDGQEKPVYPYEQTDPYKIYVKSSIDYIAKSFTKTTFYKYQVPVITQDQTVSVTYDVFPEPDETYYHFYDYFTEYSSEDLNKNIYSGIPGLNQTPDYHGKQSISFNINNEAHRKGVYLFKIAFRYGKRSDWTPVKGEQLFYFYYVKNEKIELNPNHKFGFENTPADEITQLNPLNGYGSLSEQSQTTTTINPITYDSTEYVGLESHGCLGPVAAAAANVPYGFIYDLDGNMGESHGWENVLSTGSTIMAWVKKLNSSMYFGVRPLSTLTLDGNNIAVAGNFQQVGIMAQHGQLTSFCPTIPRGACYAKSSVGAEDSSDWYHIAGTMEIVYDEDEISAQLSAGLKNNASNLKLDTYRGQRKMIVVKAYINGNLCQHTYYDLYTANNANEQFDINGVLYIGYQPIASKDACADDVQIYNYPLTVEEIRSQSSKRVMVDYTSNETIFRDNHYKQAPYITTGLGRTMFESYTGSRIAETPVLKANIPTLKIEPSRSKVFIFDNRHIAVGNDYHDFWFKQMASEYSSSVKNCQVNADYFGYTWGNQYMLKFTLMELDRKYMPEIVSRHETKDYLTVKDGDTVLSQARVTSWLNSYGLGYGFNPYDYTSLSNQISGDFTWLNGKFIVPEHPDRCVFQYIEFDDELEEGKTYSITNSDGVNVSFTYDKSSPTSSIKVNQVGYQTDRLVKEATIGMWFGPNPQWSYYNPGLSGKQFFIKNYNTDEIAYTGIVQDMAEENKEIYRTSWHNGVLMPIYFTGEITYKLDFSDFNTPGKYYIHVPNIGCSFDFEINDTINAQVFYHLDRVMYYQRSGYKRIGKYDFPNGGPESIQVYDGFYTANDGEETRDIINMDANGDAWLYGNEAKSVNRNIEAAAGTAINSLVHREIKGGHQDAGDFDRRDFHIAPITTYLASYIFWPQNFYDGQCDVEEPELLGIPDILREAMWNIKTYVDSQEEDGGCHTWFEATAHPDMIVENPIRHYPYDEHHEFYNYYMAMPCPSGNLQVARTTAEIAYALDKVCAVRAKENGDLATYAKARRLSQKYLKCSEKAFDWAMRNPEKIFSIPGNTTQWKYKQNESSYKYHIFLAATSLYTVTGDRKYKKYINDETFNSYYSMYYTGTHDQDTHSWWIPSIAFRLYDEYPQYFGKIRDKLFTNIDFFIQSQNQYQYKGFKWRINTNNIQQRGWGSSHPSCYGVWLMYAKFIKQLEDEFGHSFKLEYTQRYTYNDYQKAAERVIDTILGVNAPGMVGFTGIGKVYESRILSIPMYTLKAKYDIWEPIPGYSRYGGPFGIGNAGVDSSWENEIYASLINYGWQVGFTPVLTSYTPKWLGAAPNWSSMKTALNAKVPYEHVTGCYESLAVSEGEFTIWESQVKPLALFGAYIQNPRFDLAKVRKHPKKWFVDGEWQCKPHHTTEEEWAVITQNCSYENGTIIDSEGGIEIGKKCDSDIFLS